MFEHRMKNPRNIDMRLVAYFLCSPMPLDKCLLFIIIHSKKLCTKKRFCFMVKWDFEVTLNEGSQCRGKKCN